MAARQVGVEASDPHGSSGERAVRILLAIDGSEPSRRAVQYVAQTAALGLKADVRLLHVLPETSGDSNRKDRRARIALDIQAVDAAMREATSILIAAGVAHSTHTRVGTPADAILTFAKQQHCDHIVMGTRGLGLVAGLVLGSAATKVLQHSSVPVTFVK